MKVFWKLVAALVGVFILWLAVTMAFGMTLIAPSTTAEGEIPLVITRTWYGEIARFGSAGLLAFLGLAIALAPWRKRA